MISTPLNVLYVEDEVDLRVVLDMALKEIPNINYAIVEDAEKAIELLANEQFDIIISDHYLPNMQGIDLLEKVKMEYPEIKRFMITGAVMASVFIDAQERAEPLYIFDKPVIVEDIFEKIFSMIS
ncbi:MAG: response regulator [Candidatus Heimdallarchaeota archaeon]|nr:response regulator [Candidatus Heimdallarchaeota archaeon]